jgi:hypothetical protein
MTQNSGFLIAHINEHPEIFAKAVLARTKSSSFLYLIHCAIPAAFGYFISQEHLTVALKFYTTILTSSPPEVSIPILQPLLHSASTFRFIESSFFSVILSLRSDVNFAQMDAKRGYIPVYAPYFLKSIAASLPLLPQGIIDLLTLTANWQRGMFVSLFFDRFLWPNAVRLMRLSSGDRDLPVLQRVLEAASRDDARVAALRESLSRCRSLASPPEIYSPFAHRFLEFSLSVRDVHVLAKTVSAFRVMPDTVTLGELNHVPLQFEDRVFECQIYPRRRGRAAGPERGRLFGDADLEVLDALFASIQSKRDLEKWLEVLRSNQSLIVAALIVDAAARRSQFTFMEAFAGLRAEFNDPHLSRLIYLSLLDTRSVVAEGFTVVLGVLDTEFRETLKQYPQREGTATFLELAASVRPAARRILVDAVRGLARLDSSTLHERFRILLHTMQLLMHVQRIEDKPGIICPVVLQPNQGKELLSTFLILNTFAMNIRKFSELCADAERQMWVRFEAVILMVLRSDETFLTAYAAMQEHLREVANAELT